MKIILKKTQKQIKHYCMIRALMFFSGHGCNWCIGKTWIKSFWNSASAEPIGGRLPKSRLYGVRFSFDVLFWQEFVEVATWVIVWFINLLLFYWILIKVKIQMTKANIEMIERVTVNVV